MLKNLSAANLLKCFACLVVFIVIAFAATAQRQKQPYTLLWRISGKDLREPSYLFGTMHVKDKRVFNFSDSVMLAIQRSGSFAMEVHPDTLMRLLFKTITKPDTTRDMHKMLNEKEYAELSKKFEEKNGYKMGTNMNPLLAESLMKKDKNKPDDKESFIDAYLYGIARTMSKDIYGLENASQQFTKMVGSPDEMKERLLSLLEKGDGEDDSEEMIKIYSTGNLDNILNYIGRDRMVDSELVARNHVMVSSMITDMHKGTLFTAVGAAHLPGEYGLISLLRKEGYILTPVTATFTGVASRYHIDYDKIKWVTHTEYEKGYSLEFPSEPIKTDIYPGFTTLISPDIANDTFYGVYALQKGTKAYPANREKVIRNVVHNLSDKKDEIVSQTNTVVNGLPCTDVVVKTKRQYQRIRMFVNNNILYYIYMGNHLKSLHTSYANRFFNSFKSFHITEKPAADWTNFKNDTAAFSIKLPLTPKRIDRDLTDPSLKGQVFKIKMFLSTDTDQLMNYLVRYNDYPLGNYLADKNAVFNSLTGELSAQAKVISKPVPIWKDGYEGREVKVIFAGKYKGTVRVYLRGNRFYMLLEQNLRDNEETGTNDPFFDSFTFTPYIQPGYVNFEPQGDNYKLKLVAEPKITHDTTNDYNTYHKKLTFYATTSPTSGATYTVEHSTIGKYYRVKDIDSLYKSLTDLVIKYTDTLIKTDTIMINGKKARELVIENRNTRMRVRSRILVDDGDVFFLQSHGAEKELFNDESNTFFNSLERTGPAAKADLYSSKAKIILEGLNAADTCEFNEARGALHYYNFTADELPYIYTALQQNHPDDTSRLGARYKLIKLLRDLHDDKTIGQLQNLYTNLQGRDNLKSIVLNTIPNIDKKNGYDIYFNFLTADKPLKVKAGYTAFSPLYDSLEYTASHFQKITPFMADSTYRSEILTLASRMANQDKEDYNKVLKDNFKSFTGNAYTELAGFLASKDTNKNEYDANIYKYLNVMGAVRGEPLIDTYTNYYITNNPKGYLISNAAVVRINNRLPVSTMVIIKLLDSLDSRYEIMEAYYKQKEMIKVPPKYKTQSEYGRLCLYKEIGIQDDDDQYGYPDKLVLLGSVTDKGSIYYAYKFKQAGRDSSATYIGIAGPFKSGSSALQFKRYNAYTDYDTKKANWIKQANAMIPKLREAFELDKKENHSKSTK